MVVEVVTLVDVARVNQILQGKSVAVYNAIIVQLIRIMSILLTGNAWSVSTRVMCGDEYAIISWREVIAERSAVRRQEINTPLPSNVVIGV